MNIRHKSRTATILLLCLTLSVVDKGWVTKTHSFEFGALAITQEALYALTLGCSMLWRACTNSDDSAVDRVLQEEITRVRSSSGAQLTITVNKKQHSSTRAEVKPVAPVYSLPAVFKKTDTVADKARAVVAHVTQEQIVQAAYTAIAQETKEASQELVRHVSVDWQKQLEHRSSEEIRSAQARAYHHLFTELRALNPGYTAEIHPDGGVTYRTPNPIVYCYLGPSRQRYTHALADTISEQRLQEQMQLAGDPYLRQAIEKEVCVFLNNARYLVYGTLLERIAALLYLGDFHIGGTIFGWPLYDTQRQIYAHYVHADGSICIDRLSDMTHARTSIKKYVSCHKKVVPFFEKACVHERSVCSWQVLKKKNKINLNAIRNNYTNQCYRNMLVAFASGNMQQVEQIKNDNSGIRDIHTLYEQIQIQYKKIIARQEALLQDEFGIIHFNLPLELRDPLSTTLSIHDRIQLAKNPSARASFNDSLKLRQLYKKSLQKAWNISSSADAVVHQALYALIDNGTIPDRIDKIHEISTNLNITACERKKIVDALFLPNGIVKDFAEYDRAQSLKMPATILGEEYAQTCLLLNRLVYVERVCTDEQIKSECAAAVEYIQKSLATNDKESAERYLFYAQSMFEQIESDLILLNSEQQPTGNTNKTPQKKQSPEPKEPKNNKPDPSSIGVAAAALLQAIDESKEKAIEVFQKTCEWLHSNAGRESVMHAFRINCKHNFGPLFARIGVNIADKSDTGKKLVIESGTKILIDISQKLTDMGTKLNVNSIGVFENILIQYGGELITVQGRVHDGIIKISTMFIRPEHVR